MKSPASITVTPPLERYESAVEGDDSMEEENVCSLILLFEKVKIFNDHLEKREKIWQKPKSI